MENKDSANKVRKHQRNSTPFKKKPPDYHYLKLFDLHKQELYRIYVYAIIVDCSGIYYSSTLSKYICTLKLIDDTLNYTFSFADLPEYFSATFFARSSSRLPQPIKAGTIIRIHRGQTNKNGVLMQLNCDVDIKGAWTLFDPEDSFIAIDKSSRSYTFTKRDVETLRKLRKFINHYFNLYKFPSVGLEEAENDFDSICYVLDIKSKEKYYRILICDKKKVAKLYINKDRVLCFYQRTIIRLRSANYTRIKGELRIILNDYSNLFIIPDNYKSARILLNYIKEKKVSKQVLDGLKYYIRDPNEIISLGRPLENGLEFVQLKDLYTGKLNHDQHFFRVKVNVLEIRPREIEKCVFFINKESGARFSLKRKDKDCDEWYLKLRLIVKDCLIREDNNLYTIYLCTIDGKGKEFITFESEQWNDNYLKKLKTVYKQLLRPWTVLDCILEELKTDLAQSVFFLVNTSLILY